MFTKLEKEHIDELHYFLNNLSKEDKKYFNPHSFEKEYLESLLEQKSNYYYVLIKNNKIIGYSMLRTFNRYEKPTFGGVIHPYYRREGYGSILLANTIGEARNLGYKSVLLTVDKYNKSAIRLYEKFEFLVINEEENKIWMELIL